MENISSIIIKAKSRDWTGLLKKIAQVEFVEIGLEDESKNTIIALIIANDTQEEIASLKKINAIEDVISAEMHMSYSENELQKCDINSLAELIDKTPVEEIRYSGNVETFLKN